MVVSLRLVLQSIVKLLPKKSAQHHINYTERVAHPKMNVQVAFPISLLVIVKWLSGFVTCDSVTKGDHPH